MSNCNFCGDTEEPLDPSTKLCKSCMTVCHGVGDLIKLASKDGYIDNVKKMLVAAFADAEIYIEIMDN